MDWSFAHARPERDRDDDHTLHITCACITCALKRGACPRAHARAKSTCARRNVGALPQRMKNEWNKWKNHFYEMKGGVGMSLHEKERNKKIPTQDTKSLITPSLFLPRLQCTFSCRKLDVKMLCCLLCLMQTMLKQNKDVGMGL